jgi:hypothetical protein
MENSIENHGMTVPFRSVIIGASVTNKANIVLNLIRQMNNTFNMIYIYTHNKKEPLYKYLESIIEPKCLEIHEGLDELKNKKDIDYIGRTLIIFDGMFMDKDQTYISKFYIRGRKIGGGISLCYLSPYLYHISTTIRQHLQYIFF